MAGEDGIFTGVDPVKDSTVARGEGPSVCMILNYMLPRFPGWLLRAVQNSARGARLMAQLRATRGPPRQTDAISSAVGTTRKFSGI